MLPFPQFQYVDFSDSTWTEANWLTNLQNGAMETWISKWHYSRKKTLTWFWLATASTKISSSHFFWDSLIYRSSCTKKCSFFQLLNSLGLQGTSYDTIWVTGHTEFQPVPDSQESSNLRFQLMRIGRFLLGELRLDTPSISGYTSKLVLLNQHTPPKFNMEPKNNGFPGTYFQVPC